MKKRLYLFLGTTRNVLWIMGITSLIVLNIFKFFEFNANTLIELLHYPLAFMIVGTICDLVRLFMNRHFEYEKDEGLL